MGTAATIVVVTIIIAAVMLAVVWLWGRALEPESEVTRSVEIAATPEAALAAAADVPRVCRAIHPQTQVAACDDSSWKVRFLWVTLLVEVDRNHEQVIWRTRDNRGLAVSDWTFAAEAVPCGCRLAATEHRSVPGPFTRVWQRVWRYDPAHYLQKGLDGVAATAAGSSAARAG